MVATQTVIMSGEAEPITPEDLCRTHAASVCRFAAMMSSNRQEADDLAQEALLHAVRSLGRYNASRGSMEAWLWRIVANAARDAATRRQRLRDVVVRLGVAAPRESESVEDTVLRKLGDAVLRRELARLPLRDRTMLALRYGADLDLHQVGAAVGLSADSAGRATRRALARLRGRLEGYR